MNLFFFIKTAFLIKSIALLSAIIGTVFYSKYSMGKAKYFLFALWFIAITQFSYRFFYYQIFKEQHKVFFISNLHYIILGSFYLLWFRSLMKDFVRRKIVLALLIILLLFAVINSIFIESFWAVQPFTFAVATLCVITTILLYFVEILNTRKILKFERSVYFWFSLGILIFWVPYLPLKFTSTHFKFQGTIYDLSLFILNLLMHSFFVIGILWSKKRYNY